MQEVSVAITPGVTFNETWVASGVICLMKNNKRAFVVVFKDNGIHDHYTCYLDYQTLILTVVCRWLFSVHTF
jgi:hypothetical protein